ncbi:MocR-like pyridoxine biosynthesis transcription factor PdxR [Paraburkholderia sediminicola]|uniref:MocR-like pyridoxine biosynthesis transcription factor PdxR n=1 Tax=Paraburkholderia sediminicola TaxID=458836 RepID=UPI0038BC54C6
MAKTITAGVFSSFTVTAQSTHPAYRQLYFEFRKAILSGRLPSAARLPATRVLAKEMGVSRNTVVSAFELLVDEGYLISRVGSGTFVASDLPEDHQLPHQMSNSDTLLSEGQAISLSTRGLQLARFSLNSGPTSPAAFTPDIPAYDAFPLELWGRIISNAWRNISIEQLGYTDPAGMIALRKAISSHLRAGRLVDCQPEQVIVTSGSQQSFDLVARLLLNPGDPVWIEEPSYIGSRAALLGAGAQLVPVPVDEDGMNTVAGLEKVAVPRMIMVTPSRQYPLGMMLSMARRESVLEISRETGAWIIEDDYDSEYRYRGQPLPALQSMDKQSRVIYLGTFSKALLPSFRLGYMVVPRALVDDFRAAKAIIDRHPPLLEQIALCEFMEKGYFASHLRKMRHLYSERQQKLIELLRERLGDILDIREADSGMHVVAFLPVGVSDTELCADLAAGGIIVRPLSPYYMSQPARSGIILGFAAVPVSGVQSAVTRMEIVIKGHIAAYQSV